MWGTGRELRYVAQQANQARTVHVLDSQTATRFARVLFAALGLMKTSVVCFCLLVATYAFADGLALKNGRYPGAVAVFQLTDGQKKTIEQIRVCYLERGPVMNRYTPYVFELTHEQRESLKKRKGFSPRYFNVYETYRGFNDAGPHWNLALRFSEEQIEIPMAIVINDAKAAKWHEMQGWELANPCFPNFRKAQQTAQERRAQENARAS